MVVGDSWLAHDLAERFGCWHSTLEDAWRRNKKLDVIVHADHWAEADTALSEWRWMFRALVTRALFSNTLWIQMSTVHVLSGSRYDRPYRHGDKVCPYDLEGEVAAALEWALLSLSLPTIIARRGLCYAEGQEGGLLDWMDYLIETATEEQGLVVSPDIVTPTYAGDLATWIQWAIDQGPVGIRHLSARGPATYREIAEFVAEVRGLPPPNIVLGGPDMTELPNRAILSNFKTRHWKEAMREVLTAT